MGCYFVEIDYQELQNKLIEIIESYGVTVTIEVDKGRLLSQKFIWGE